MSKTFYPEIAYSHVLFFHERTHLSWSLNLICFKDLLLESYKYDKTKVRTIINSQIVHQIFKIQQHLRTAMGLKTVPRLNIKGKHLQSKNANFQNNFRVIAIVFGLMNLRNEFHKMFRNNNKQKIKVRRFWHYIH